MWLFPWLTWLVIVFICAALAVMMIAPEHRTEVSTTIGLALLISFIGLVTSREQQQSEEAASWGKSGLSSAAPLSQHRGGILDPLSYRWSPGIQTSTTSRVCTGFL